MGRVWTPLLLVVSAAATGVVTYRLSSLANSTAEIPPLAVQVDLERGVAWTSEREPLRIPRRPLQITCYLPRDARSGGAYNAFIRGERGEEALALGRFLSHPARFGPALSLAFDARSLAFGEYVLELRQASQTPLRYPLRIVH